MSTDHRPSVDQLLTDTSVKYRPTIGEVSVNEKLYRPRHIWNNYQPCLDRVWFCAPLKQLKMGPSKTVHSPLFFSKIIEIEGFVLRAAILHECQNYLGGRGGLGGNKKNRGTVITSLQLAFRRRDRNFTPFTIH